MNKIIKSTWAKLTKEQRKEAKDLLKTWHYRHICLCKGCNGVYGLDYKEDNEICVNCENKTRYGGFKIKYNQKMKGGKL